MNQVRLDPKQRRSLILNKAVVMANEVGLYLTTPRTVAQRYNFAYSTVRYYFNQNSDLWRSIVAHSEAAEPVRRDGSDIGLM